MEYKVDDTGLQAAVFLPFVSLHNRKRKRIKDVASMQYTMTKASRPCPAALLTLTSVWSVAADRGCIAHYAPCTDQSKLLFRTTEGSGILTATDGQQFSLTQQSLIWLPAAQISACACETPAWTVQCFAFEADTVPFAAKTVYTVPLSADEAMRLQEIAHALLSEADAGYASAAFSAVLARWAHCIHTAESPPSLFSQITQYIGLQPFGTLSIEALAERFGVSDRTLRNLFYQQAGVSPKQYIEARQAAAAKDLLLATDLPIRDIAALLGFDDPYYFSRFIKKQFQLSPSQLRDTAAPPTPQPEAEPAPAQKKDLSDTPWLL